METFSLVQFPSSVAFLGSLELLYLNDNFLDVTVPEKIGAHDALDNFERLDLHQNELSGPVFREFPRIIAYMDFHQNRLEGSIPGRTIQERANVKGYISANSKTPQE